MSKILFILLLFMFSCVHEDIDVELEPMELDKIYVDFTRTNGEYGHLNINGWNVYVDDFTPFTSAHLENIDMLTLNEDPTNKIIFFGFTHKVSAYTKTKVNGEWKGVIIIPAVIEKRHFWHEIGHHIHRFYRADGREREIIDEYKRLPRNETGAFEWFAELYVKYRQGATSDEESKFIEKYL